MGRVNMLKSSRDKSLDESRFELFLFDFPNLESFSLLSNLTNTKNCEDTDVQIRWG